jgi:hypothetical protein
MAITPMILVVTMSLMKKTGDDCVADEKRKPVIFEN